MLADERFLDIRLARDADDVLGAQRLRYRVFVEELGARAASADHVARYERDRFDVVCDHMLLVDRRRDPASHEHVVGVYRLLRGEVAAVSGGFYCETEYDLGPLRRSGRRLLELGRSCIAPEYRGGTGMYRLWEALGDYVLRHGVEVMFGVASFHGTDVAALAEPLSYLHHNHLAPDELRTRVLPAHFVPTDPLPPEAVNRKTALARIPALIKAYLRLGGFVGEGAYVDHDFNTTDVCLVMDAARVPAARRAHYQRTRLALAP